LSTPNRTFTFTAPQAGERLDKLIVAHVGDQLTRSQIQAFIRDGHVSVNGEPAKSGWRLKGGETVTLTVPQPPQETGVEPVVIPLNVIYEDEDIAVINKTAGLVVHPGAGGERSTLVHAILAQYPEIAQMNYAASRRGIVHRLDKDTSGIILIARNERSMHRLMVQFQKRTIDKQYVALLERTPKTTSGRINVPIERDPSNRQKMHVSREGRVAVTEFFVEEIYEGGTGRTHQIRVHMAYLNTPIVGDRLYGQRRQRLPLARQFLHATQIAFDHPRTGQRMQFSAPLAAELQAVLDTLKPIR
jgi:23S rRNA pseudouridine1911/1915/1917 synthase